MVTKDGSISVKKNKLSYVSQIQLGKAKQNTCVPLTPWVWNKIGYCMKAKLGWENQAHLYWRKSNCSHAIKTMARSCFQGYQNALGKTTLRERKKKLSHSQGSEMMQQMTMSLNNLRANFQRVQRSVNSRSPYKHRNYVILI